MLNEFEFTNIRKIVREELSLDQTIRERRAGRSVKECLYVLAQELVNEVKPGETVQEVLINTNSAEPIAEVIEQAKEIVANSKKQSGKKTIFTVMFCGSASIWPSKEISETFTSIKDAVDAIEKSEGKSLFCQYFVKESEVDA